MGELRCPKCGEVFKVDESGYAAIVSQVRTAEFNQEIASREAAIRQLVEKEGLVRLHDAVAGKDREIRELGAEKDREIRELGEDRARTIADLETQIAVLRSDLENGKKAHEAEIGNAVAGKEALIGRQETEIGHLKKELERLARERDDQLESLRDKSELEKQTALQAKDGEIIRLQADLKALGSDVERRILLAMQEKDAEIARLCEKSSVEMERRDQEIARLKDFKARYSTKMLGNSLEEHCATEFERIRSLLEASGSRVFFAKDTEGDSRGDFIFREFCLDENDEEVELFSIMFEMKNEAEDTAVRKKNDDFLKKLDEDRRKKGCEFAVLVSMLELDNDVYNAGIVDKSHVHEKMYVVRPQCFIPIITILRQAARKSLEYKVKLRHVEQEHIDITNFEDRLFKVTGEIAEHYGKSIVLHEKAVADIDRAIRQLEHLKEDLRKSMGELRKASGVAEKKLTIRSLAYGNKGMQRRFAELEKDARPALPSGAGASASGDPALPSPLGDEDA